MSENSKKLTRTTIVMHWLTGLSFIGVFIVGLIMAEMERGPDKFELMGYHKSIGAIILMIALLRIVWRLKEGKLSSLGTSLPWQEKMAHAVHGILMLATIAMPISGIAMSAGGGRAIDIFGWVIIEKGDKIEWLQQLGGTIHHSAVNIIIAVFALHIIGAVKHHFIDKDATITRMLGK
ncbi:cytochrome B [Vibrio sp. UCD-FRSSP16_10]|uniref:cytochrome b n=1 Tax=unclassified Vibrio TaxID=2614977 RepID=UPI0007FE0929|nr:MULTISPECIES: cytochrome b [unclassified Vibrio]OBT12063.1 cytochrome B [Vibrio sp. UCD-FRSSP16_30]OBT20394.1 cytochrome B [Vibrio sp. UCD-FRSSP16_10]